MKLHSGLPFWRLRDGLLSTFPALRADASADVAVIGAGITGALVAHELTRAGAEVLVIDREDAGSGSSAATSGLLLYDTDVSLADMARSIGPDGAERVYTLGLHAIDRIEHLCATLGDSCGFCRRPSVYLASRARDVRDLQTEFAGRSAMGLDVEWLTRASLDASYSFSAPAAIRARGTAEVNCYRLAHRLLQTAERAGAKIYDRTTVTQIRAGRAGVTLDIEGGHQVRAAHIVAAAGYETALKLRRRTGKLASTWAFVSEPLDGFDGWPDRCLIWETARPYLYLRSTDDGRLLAGGEDEPAAKRHESPATFDRKMARLAGRVRQMFPRIRIDVAYGWAGTFATTDDGLPFIGSVPEWPGVWFALGYGGNGITFSVIAAELIRDAYLGRPNPDARLFAFDR